MKSKGYYPLRKVIVKNNGIFATEKEMADEFKKDDDIW
jgi:hypothetical protein